MKHFKRKRALTGEIARLEEEEKMLLHSLKSEFGDNYEDKAEKLREILDKAEEIFKEEPEEPEESKEPEAKSLEEEDL